MRIKEDFVLRKVSENWIVLPLGEKTVDFSGMLNLNESGAMLWEVLTRGASLETLVQALTDEYEVSQERARQDVEKFLQKLDQAGCLDSES